MGSILGWGALQPKTPNKTQIKMAHIKKKTFKKNRRRETPGSILPFSLLTHSREEVTRGHGEQVAVCSPRGDSAPEPSHAGTFILDFKPPELLGNRFLLFKPLSLRHFVTVVQADTGGFFPKAFRENSALLTP